LILEILWWPLCYFIRWGELGSGHWSWQTRFKECPPLSTQKRSMWTTTEFVFAIEKILQQNCSVRKNFFFFFCLFSDFFVTDMATLYPRTTKIKKKKKRIGMPLYKWYRWCLLKSLQCNTQSRIVNLN
jgi:hypothetical protein